MLWKLSRKGEFQWTSKLQVQSLLLAIKKTFAKLFLLSQQCNCIYFFVSKGAYSAWIKNKNKPDLFMQKMLQKSAEMDALELQAPFFLH